MEKLQTLLSNCMTDMAEIAAYLGMEEQEAAALEKITEKYPVCSTKYYLDLIDPYDPADPIRKMCIPDLIEYAEDGVEDTSGENDNTVIKGMQHKYRQTALILSTNQCAMYCRHCFRKRMVGSTSDEIAANLDQMKAYIEAHPQINNILISGGDSLLNTNVRIREYLDTFVEIESLDFIRFGTRVPVVMPERIYDDPDLLDLLEAYNEKKQLMVVTQFNHPNEITEASAKAVSALLKRGLPVRNQTVLLKGINDDPAVLAKLMNGLTGIGVLPYYIFQCRPARGVVNNFQVPIRAGIRIVEEAKTMMNGQAKSLRYVMSHPSGKIEILGAMGEEILFKYHQSKYEKDASRMFTVTLEEDDCWLGQI